MGNVLSSASDRGRAAEHVTSESETMNDQGSSSNLQNNGNIDGEDLESTSDEARAKCKEDEMIEFRKELSIKREQRKQILARHRAEKEELEKEVNNEKKCNLELNQTNQLLRELLVNNNIEIPEHLLSSNQDLDLISTITQMREEFEILRSNNNKLRKELAESNNTLQNANADIADLNGQNIESMKQISALKEVVSVSKTMIELREQQLTELKDKLSDIEKSLADREASMLSNDLRQEYERQLQNIRTLRSLYEERARLAEVTRVNLARELEEQKLLNQAEINKSKGLSDKVQELEDKIDALIETIQNKNNQISLCQDESIGLRAEMAVVNKLFSEVLLGYKTKKDLDKLAHRLEENHGILTQMAERESDSEALTALPKLLLELVNQVDEGEEKDQNESEEIDCEISVSNQETSEEDSEKSGSTTAEDIVENLPKVWRVLMELLSHQNVADATPVEKVTTCYKSVETKSGPVLVPSVSQTYIRLKDLIIEKLSLVKEVNRMKQLNTHLETRLEEQERKLCLVTTELSKTWHVVGRLRRHHHQLHTHEKILKYELQQKRKLLNELKEELECCREKWEQAREKNTQSEKDWRKLRAEFSSRKANSPSFNNSGESGYSDERPSDESSESNDESEYVTEPPLRCKKKFKKSFETILDSSTDFNLAAEREDPASDMLDVADLPLDTQDESHSENFQKSEVLCEETEDEIGDITIDHCTEETSTSGKRESPSNNEQGIRKESGTSQNQINSTEVFQNNIQKMATKEQVDTNKSNEQPNNTIDHVLDQSGSSREIENQGDSDSVKQFNKTDNENETRLPQQSNDATSATQIGDKIQEEEHEDSEKTIKTADEADENATSLISSESSDSTSESSSSVYQTPKSTIVDFQSILESIKKQDERLANRDKRMEKMENDCSEVITNLSGTLKTGDSLHNKLETIHAARAVSENTDRPEGSSKTTDSNNDPEPSTSNEIDHEARFAARDIRLKRLEEQTKSLVNKVNKTTSKGVKIHYKLEELHNIYGSENSRAGTPSEDNDEKSIEEETQNE